MNSLIFDFGNGISIHNIIGRGIVITFPSYLKNKEIQPLFKQHVGDKWIFEFTNTDLAEKIVEVKGVEIFNSFLKNESPYALCFGGQFNKEQIDLMKHGQVSFRKIINNAPIKC